MELLIQNVTWEHEEQLQCGALRIKNGHIVEIDKDIKPNKSEIVIDGKGDFVYPGLINSHDHLEMNIYPRLGKPPYEDYVAWANDIYKPHAAPVSDIEALPLRDRLLFGAFKNIISGVTTVVHHNPYYARFRFGFPISVFSRYQWMHSLVFGKKIRRRWFGTQKLIIHAAEGINERAAREIDELDNLGYLRRQTVLVHGVAISANQINRLQEKGASLVWCPSSNIYLFGRTAPIDILKHRIPVALGTDSTLTGSPTLLDEIRDAIKTGLVSENEIFHMVTNGPSRIFGLQKPMAITKGAPADLFIATRKQEDYKTNLTSTYPDDIRLVLHNGCVRLLRGEPPHSWPFRLKRLFIRQNYLCIHMPSLMKRITSGVPSVFLQQNPVWKIAETWI